MLRSDRISNRHVYRHAVHSLMIRRFRHRGLKGYWSISISGNWRVIFRFEDGDAYDVDLIDYH